MLLYFILLQMGKPLNCYPAQNC